MTTPVKTGWVCIASAGPTVDGQEIAPEWLRQMAESYDPDFYTACLWPEHGRSRPVGHVESLKVDTQQGTLKLFAVLCPTLELIELNASGRLQFCSIEPKPDFAGTGKWYLGALGVTDEPASTGVTRLKFSQARPLIGQSHRWTAPSQLTPNNLAPCKTTRCAWPATLTACSKPSTASPPAPASPPPEYVKEPSPHADF
ncbi:GPO family capsid scaffolding protein [Aeromonas hydrophila]|uniref:GPO family capsid scaffolding protein n=1 Tax=Aeromonas hydrophila TaxID=644 RepID=UPI00188F2209|nr:GPO family capsid scaffolding protein [Aeromonas hydrophila]MBF4801321.1 hypothetical protein [Aeromonas hydrophila]